MIDEYNSYTFGESLLNNQFKFIKHLQDGSFGKVTLAYDIINQRQVSLKIIPKNFRSLQEIQYLERLKNHPNICSIYNYFTIGNRTKYYVLCLEYYSNGDLYDLIHTRNLSTNEIILLSNQLISALKYSHSLGIYHRDLKPENILIDSENNFKIGDWGLATSIRFNNEFKVGSDRYMSPECKQLNNEKNLDCKYSDYWSIGVTILTAILGSCPFKTNLSIKQGFDFIPNFKNKEIFLDFLKYGDEEKIRQRDLDLFLNRINEEGVNGFEEEEEEEEEKQEDEVFSMEFEQQQSSIEIEYKDNDDYDVNDLPGLVKNSYQSSKSWCDYDDFDFELEISKLNLSNSKKFNIGNNDNINDKKFNGNNNGNNNDDDDANVRIIETEIFDIIDV